MVFLGGTDEQFGYTGMGDFRRMLSRYYYGNWYLLTYVLLLEQKHLAII